jgi:acyl carrier protein
MLDDDPRVPTIIDIVAKETGIEASRLTMDASMAELGIPSLDLVQAIFELETRFGFEIPVVPERAGAEFDTVGDLVRHVLAAMDNRAAGTA